MITMIVYLAILSMLSFVTTIKLFEVVYANIQTSRNHGATTGRVRDMRIPGPIAAGACTAS